MLHEIFPDSFNNSFQKNRQIVENDLVFCFKNNELLLKNQDGELLIPQKADFAELKGLENKTYLFSLNEQACFLLWDDIETSNSSLTFSDMNFFRTARKDVAWLGLVAQHLHTWYSENRFCGKCGHKTHEKTNERALVCPTCKHVIYPRISPAIIVAVTCGDNIILARNSTRPAGWFSILAGFSDVGETLEQTVIREVKEEVGIDVSNIRYYKSSPWPLSGSIMVGFIADADEKQPIVIDNDEIAEAAWFSRDNLPDYPSTRSIAGEMVDKFKKGEL